jgi:macrolide transport system ATP-binding/permease protein
MSLWKKLTHLLPWVRRAEERDIREELESLREMAGAGELGNLSLAAEDARGVFQFRWLEEIVQDLRYAGRSMRHDMVFTILAVASLALGIGASTAIYSFMDSILLRSLPIPHAESLVVMKWRGKTYAQSSRGVSWSTGGSTHDDNGVLSSSFPYPALDLFQQRSDIVKDAFGYYEVSGLNVSVGNESDEAAGQFVTGRYFAGMGIAPAGGRLIDANDDRDGSATVAVVSERFSVRRFGDRRRAVGQVIRINDKPFDVIGVVPDSFFGAEPGTVPDFYMPMRAKIVLGFADSSDFTTEHYYWMDVMARLQPGVTLVQAQAALSTPFHRFVEDSATTDRQRADLPELRLESGAAGLDTLRRTYAQPIYVLIAVVAGILLIACSNIANLLLARASARRREIAIRLGIGAARARVIRQLLTESVLLSSIGGALGLALARWSIPVLTVLLSNGRSNFTLHAALNWRVLGITIALSTVTGLLFGLAPALQGTRLDIATALKSLPAGQSGRKRGGAGAARGLVVIQIAMSLMLLVAAGLFGRTLANLHGINLGFNRENVLLFTIRPGSVGIAGSARVQLFEDLRTRLRALPGVAAVSLSSQALPMGGGTSAQMQIVGTPAPLDANGRPPYAVLLTVGPDFFSTMQIPLISGREFTDRDVASTPKIVVVNRNFAHAFGIANPVGQIVATRNAQYTVVGVVDDALTFALKEARRPAAYFPYLQAEQPASGMTYEVRTIGGPLNLAAPVGEIVRAADWRLAVLDMRTQAAHIDHGISQEITLARLCSTFAIVALIIACVGLYGTVAFNVARRTNEIGIRMALGASGRRIVWMVLRDVLVMVGAGFAVGLPLVYLGTRYVTSFMYGITPHDPLSVAGALAVLLTAAVLAGLTPARRAARIAPMGAVRRE